MKLTENELKDVLRLHKMRLDGENGGKLACLCNADLSYVNLSDADLRWVNLRNADLGHANLNYANLRDAYLSAADLHGADLRQADLSYADLSDADLSYADLSDVDLSNADLRGANLRGIKCGFNAFFGGIKGAPIYQAVCGFGSRNAALTLLAQGKREEWRWFTGCFKGSEVDLRIAVQEKHGDTPEERRYLRAIDYLIEQAEDNKNKSE